MTLATLLLPLAFVLPSMLRPSPVPAHTSSAVSMCAWDSRDEAFLQNAIKDAAAKQGDPQHALYGLRDGWVLIFNQGQQDEGVYTLQGGMARADPYVLAFEAGEDAGRFAQMLQGQGLEGATPLRWGVDELHDFCVARRFAVSVVRKDCLIAPPKKNEFDVDAFNRVNGGMGDRFGESQGSFSQPDKFSHERAALEHMLEDEANCGDDDCLL